MSETATEETPAPRVLGGKFKYKGIRDSEWQEHQTSIEQPLQIICHQGDTQVDSDEHIPMNYEVTTYHGERVVNIDPVAKAWAEYILNFSLDGIAVEDRTKAMQHVIGMCDLPIKLMQKAKSGLPIFFKEPETSLHPSQQSNIACFLGQLATKTDNDTGIFTVMPDKLYDIDGEVVATPEAPTDAV